jgi:hypothetical protein
MANPNYTYEINTGIVERIAAEFVQTEIENDPAFKILPLKAENSAELRWTQEDSDYGLAQWRGMNGEPGKVKRLGETTTVFEPGVYGETSEVDEQELTQRAQLGTNGAMPIDVQDLIGAIDRQLIRRDIARKTYNIWNALQGTLTLSKPGANGGTQQTFSYVVQTYTANPAFSNLSTGAPIQTFQAVQQLGVGRSLDLGAGATAYCNQYTFNNILNNANAADFGGRRDMYGATLNNLMMVNNYWQSQNLPKFVISDNGYYPTQTSALNANVGPANFSKFIPNNKIIVVGRRTDGSPIGKYAMTRHVVGTPASGDWRIVQDAFKGMNAPLQVPGYIRIGRGHNGGPVIHYSSAIVIISC